MKRYFVLCLVLLWTGVAGASGLKVGDQAPDFKLNDAKGKEYSLNSPEFTGRVLFIMYVDPDEKDLNAHVEDALIKEREAGGFDLKAFRSFGVTNLKDTIKPNFLIRQIVKSKQQKTGAIILMDPNHTLLNLWGLKRDSSDAVLLDKNRVCLFIHKGKVPQEEVRNLISLIKEHQTK